MSDSPTFNQRGSSNQMWGGRFLSGPETIMEEMNASIDFDQYLYSQDIAGSRAHVLMLEKQGLISPEDTRSILRGLESILSELESGTFKFSRQLEDIHMNIESRLENLIGPAAGRLHTARSRNDQVATDFRLWIKQTAKTNITQLRGLIVSFLDKAEQHANTIIARIYPFTIGTASHLWPSLSGLCGDVFA